MASCSSDSSRLEVIRERARHAGSLLLQANQLKVEKNVGGVQRLERKIKAEKTFLESILSGETALTDNHLSSSNLTHIEAVLHTAEEIEKPVAVQKCFTLVPGVGKTPVSVQVDVVGAGGGRWVRVFCRKRSALHHRWLGDGQFGDKSVSDISAEYMEASRQNPHKFQPPTVSFLFFDGITESVSDVLQGGGIEVLGPVYADESAEKAPLLHHVASLVRRGVGRSHGSDDRPYSVPMSASAEAECGRVNMDVSSMLAWVSSLTHGGGTHFEDKVLNEQAEQERISPLWPQLQRATEGKQLVVCRSAIDRFSSIVETVGGEQEKIRARSLVAMVQVVEDCPSSRAMALSLSHRIKHRSKVVFGSGDTLKATTLTANEGFVRAAAHQGVNFEVSVHQSRALTELKELSTCKR